MSQTERVHRIQQMLRERRVVPRHVFLEELEISPAQFKRDLAFLRDRFRVPIHWERERRGYTWPESDCETARFELPGPLYTGSEIHAMLLMQDLLNQLQPGLLDEHLGPLRERLKMLLGTTDLPSDEIRRRVRILHVASRPVEPKIFRAVSEATLGRVRLRIVYRSRSRNTTTEREISPQRLILYRGNWYVDAWCHLRGDLRSFAVDAVVQTEIVPERAREVAEEALDVHLGSSYGIFSGAPQKIAVLRFEPHIARWVSQEVWHSDQERALEPSGHLVLKVPYAHEQELLMDVLRYGPQVEVLAPNSLREKVKEQLHQALERY